MDYDTHFRDLGAGPGGAAADSDEVEIFCPDLRVDGRLALGQFRRLSDLFNQNIDYVVIRGARLLALDGQPTGLEVPELMIRRADITFIGQAATAVQPRGGGPGGMSSFDRPTLSKVARRVVFFTLGSGIAANVHMLEQMTLATFLDAREPHFIPTTAARVRSVVGDRAVVGEFGLLLLNRDRITGAAEASLAGSAAE